MKKISLISLPLLVAMTSCNPSQIVSFLPPVNIDKTVTMEPAKSIAATDKLETKGDQLYLVAEGTESSGKVVVHPSDSPYAPLAAEKAALVLTFQNPSASDVEMAGTVAVGSVTAKLPAVTVPAGKTVVEVVSDDPEAGAGVEGAVVTPIPASLKPVLTSALKDDIVISDLDPKTKAGSIVVSVAFKVPLIYAPGTVINISKSFTDLGINLSEYGIDVSEYEITVDVKSTVPLAITVSGVSADGLSASLNNEIKPGDIGSPVTTSVVASVKSSAAVKTLNSAKINFVLTAPAGGAVLKNGQTLEVNYKTIKIKKL